MQNDLLRKENLRLLHMLRSWVAQGHVPVEQARQYLSGAPLPPL